MPVATEPVSIDNSAVFDIAGALKKQQQEQHKDTPTTTETIIFLDWDDTLLCSSVLSECGLKLDSDLSGHDDLLRQLDELSTSILSILDAAVEYGQVIIVTNGQTGWVQLSAQKFVPRVLAALDRIPILSARSTFEDRFPGKPMEWKYHAFEQELAGVLAVNCNRNILSFGDSNAEREAIRAVTNGMAHTRCKSIKFMERPSIRQLQRQLEVVVGAFPYLFKHEDHLDLRLAPYE